MNKKRVLPVLGFVVLAVSVLAFGKLAKTNPSALQQSLQTSSTIPDHVAYDFLFRHTSSLESVFRREANLGDAQIRVLNTIAAACMLEVRQQDERAQAIIKAFRARYPGGIVPQGERLPPPPPELKRLWEERGAIILRRRAQIRAAFGEQGFNRFEEFVKKRFGSNIT